MLIPGKFIFPAFTASVVVPTALFMLVGLLLDEGMRAWWGVMLPTVFLISLGHAFLLGLPCTLYLGRRGKIRLWSLALAGFLIGALPSLLGALLRNPSLVHEGFSNTLLAVAGLGGLGLSGGVAFFLVWKYQSE